MQTAHLGYLFGRRNGFLSRGMVWDRWYSCWIPPRTSYQKTMHDIEDERMFFLKAYVIDPTVINILSNEFPSAEKDSTGNSPRPKTHRPETKQQSKLSRFNAFLKKVWGVMVVAAATITPLLNAIARCKNANRRRSFNDGIYGRNAI